MEKSRDEKKRKNRRRRAKASGPKVAEAVREAHAQGEQEEKREEELRRKEVQEAPEAIRPQDQQTGNRFCALASSEDEDSDAVASAGNERRGQVCGCSKPCFRFFLKKCSSSQCSFCHGESHRGRLRQRKKGN